MTPLLITHILTCTLGYALFALACGIAFVFIRRERAIKEKTLRLDQHFRLSLGQLDRVLLFTLFIGLALLTVGIPTGLMVQRVQHGAMDITSMRLVFPFVIWLFYLLIIVFRRVTGLRGKAVAHLAFYGFSCSVLSFLMELALV